MDEPFVGLDPKAAHLLKGMMREACAQGSAIFFSTHVLEVAEKLCDKVAIIKEGQAHPVRHDGRSQGRRFAGAGVPGTGGGRMLKLLLKKQLTEIFRSYVYDAKKNRARSKAGTAAYIALFVLLMVGVLGGLFTMLSLSLCNTMARGGAGLAVFCDSGAAGNLAWARLAACSIPMPGCIWPRIMICCSRCPSRCRC